VIEFGRINAGKPHVDAVYDDGVSVDHPAPTPQYGFNLGHRLLIENDDVRLRPAGKRAERLLVRPN